MKLYIFIASGGYGGINGAIIYVMNKKIYLEEKGWNVFILAKDNDNVVIPYYIENPILSFQELQFSYSQFNKRKSSLVIESMIDEMDIRNKDIDECIIESYTDISATWVEELAHKLSGKHIFNCVRENPHCYNEEYFKFLKFKYDRHELFGMSKNTVSKFLDAYMEIEPNESLQIKTPCDNSVQDIETDLIRKINLTVDYRICTVARLDKGYIIPMINGIEEFCLKNKKTVQIVFIAGAYHKEAIVNIQNRLKNNKYITYVITGFLFPVPAKLLHMMDLAICTAGAVLTTYGSGVPTISMDVSSYDAIGIYGYNTYNTHYHSDEESIPLSYLIEKVLINKILKTENKLPDYSYVNEILEEGLQKVNEYYSTKEYYDVYNVINLYGKYKLNITISRLFSPQFYKKLVEIKARWKNK